MIDDLVRRRTETKHVFPAGKGEELRARLQALRPGAAERRTAGWVTTVYFDLPDRRYAREALARPEANLKIRLREYFTEQEHPCSPFVWLEIKEREGALSRKSRFQLHKRMVGGFLEGELDLAAVLTCQEKGADLDRVVEAVQRLHQLAGSPLAPLGAVRYRRCSVQGGDPGARVTLDRDITFHAGPAGLYEEHAALNAEALGAPLWIDGAAVLEIKHQGPTPPAWCRPVAGGAAPAEYSKFLLLARLAAAEAAA